MSSESYLRLPASWQAASDTLKDRVVLIAGASGGLGRAACLAAAQAGASVVLVGRKTRALEKIYDDIVASGAPQPAIYPLNLEGATPNDYVELAATLEKEFGRLDGLVNAAAHFSGLQPAGETEPLVWMRTLHVNLTAPFLLVQACLPLLERSSDASVVFVLDDPARMRKAFWGAYGAAKGALQTLIFTLHEETESGSVRVHGLLPAPMRTMLRRTAYFGENSLELPLPDVTAPALVYLLSADATVARGKILDLRTPTLD